MNYRVCDTMTTKVQKLMSQIALSGNDFSCHLFQLFGKGNSRFTFPHQSLTRLKHISARNDIVKNLSFKAFVHKSCDLKSLKKFVYERNKKKVVEFMKKLKSYVQFSGTLDR